MQYLRNITYFLMVATVVGMVAPGGKYKKFVSLVMGFILLSVMIAPLANFRGQVPVTNWFGGMLPAMATEAELESSYSNWRATYLAQAFQDQLAIQLENLLEQNGFTVHHLSFTFPQDFTRLTSVTAVVSRPETPQRVPFIRIQPVQIGGQQPEEDCPTSLAAKNLISEFYNLPMEHIYVTVRD